MGSAMKVGFERKLSVGIASLCNLNDTNQTVAGTYRWLSCSLACWLRGGGGFEQPHLWDLWRTGRARLPERRRQSTALSHQTAGSAQPAQTAGGRRTGAGSHPPAQRILFPDTGNL